MSSSPDPKDGAKADEERFIKALKGRDPRAFNALVLRFQDRVFNLIRRLLGNPEEAQDVTQEVFVAIFEKVDTYRGDSTLATWIYRIAANHAKNRIKYLARRKDRQRESLEHMLTPPTASQLSAEVPRPDQAYTRERVSRLVDWALGELDEEQRLVLVLRDVEGQSYEDIAVITGLNLGTVKSRLHRGRLKLKEALTPYIDPRDFSEGGDA
jgi:RNA polymerase sigma-70 factor (ECF subfamily)